MGFLPIGQHAEVVVEDAAAVEDWGRDASEALDDRLELADHRALRIFRIYQDYGSLTKPGHWQPG